METADPSFSSHYLNLESNNKCTVLTVRHY